MLQQEAINVSADSKEGKNPDKTLYEQDPTHISRNYKSRSEQVLNTNVDPQTHLLQASLD